jgi:ABC-2 type transport system ATP-binding protein
MEYVLESKGLRKVFRVGFWGRRVTAVDGVSLEVRRGEVFGFLGPNGAGKTTTIRTLLDLIRPSSGSAAILGLDSKRDSVKIHAQVGFLPSEMGLYQNMTGRQYVRFVERARGVGCMAEAERLARQLDYDLDRSLEGLSSGNKRKIGLIVSLMHRAPLLILDEPSSGLDPLMQQIFNELMREVRAEGRTVFLSSHNLPEVEALCDRVGILRNGHLTAVEEVQSLTHLRFRWFILDFEEPVSIGDFAGLPGVTDLQISNGNTRLKLQVSGVIDPVIKLAARYTLRDLSVEHPSLEEIFLEYYGNNSHSGGAKLDEPVDAVSEMEHEKELV